MNIDDIIDGIVTILLLALFIPITVKCAIPLYSQQTGGFGIQIEKTALKSHGEIIPMKRPFTSQDTILLLAIADRYTPEPEEVEINGTTVHINGDFFSNPIPAMESAYHAMPYVENMTLQLYVGPTGPRKWVIQDE